MPVCEHCQCILLAWRSLRQKPPCQCCHQSSTSTAGEYAMALCPAYGRMQAARRARVRRSLWWATLGVAVIGLLCCSGIVVSQISFGGSARPVAIAWTGRDRGKPN